MSGGSTLFRGSVQGFPGRELGLLVEGGVVTWVGEGAPPRRPYEEIVAGPGETIAPGFIDPQVNGFAGHDAAGGTDAIEAISQALPRTGGTAFLPTPLSSPLEVGAR